MKILTDLAESEMFLAYRWKKRGIMLEYCTISSNP